MGLRRARGALGLPGARRRFTGSYDAGEDFPATSWVADRPRRLDGPDFSLEDARALLLATRVGDDALSHGHGAPCRLVVPGRRGFQWVKWVTRVVVHEDPDPGAIASAVWSSFTPEGRGTDRRDERAQRG
jgi:DMSO/TMAO reductase YedYZ molybdopterin-dependent catalytic subunit